MLRALLSLFFIAYFAVWLFGGLSVRPTSVCPEWLLFFTRSACLFPNAATDSVDYYAEGWDCATRQWIEVDHTPYFPIVISGRERRFDRLVHLFRRNQEVLRRLRVFLLGHYDSDHPDTPIADVRLLSVRIPVPPPGGEVQRYEHRPLHSIPKNQHKVWSRPIALFLRDARCQALLQHQSVNLQNEDGL